VKSSFFKLFLEACDSCASYTKIHPKMATMLLKEILVNTDMPSQSLQQLCYVDVDFSFFFRCFVLKSTRKELGDMSVFTGISFERGENVLQNGVLHFVFKFSQLSESAMES